MSLLHHFTIMNRAKGNGDLFPTIGQKPQSAPSGSSENPIGGSLWSRITKEVMWFRHTTHTLHLTNWPSMHIVHLTDVHIRDEGLFLDRVISEVKGLHPDLIVLTGDLITKGWTGRAIDRFLGALSTVPKIAILGNWEHWVVGSLLDWKHRLERFDIRLLVDEVHSLSVNGTEIQILGTDDHLAGNSNPAALCGHLTELQERPPTLCLTHSPAHFDALHAFPIDLILAGHAHGGQIRLPKLGALWVPKGTKEYVAGWYTQSDSHLFVSRGMGWSVAPIRWRCPPEIAHIFINPNQST